MNRIDLKDKVIVITGSTGGLGAALSVELAERGAKLALMDIDSEKLRKQASELGGLALSIDVTSYESLELAMAKVFDYFGKIDIVVANAGITKMAPMISSSEKDFSQVIDINLNGPWRTFKAALPYITQSKGYMAAICSMASFVHCPLQASYAASKAGLHAVCNSVRMEVRHLGVDIGSFHPTFFPSPLMDGVTSDPVGNKLWGGNKEGPWKMISLEEVVSEIISGIEQRAEQVVIPKRKTLVAKASGFFRRYIERRGFKGNEIEEAISLSQNK
ncbi:SDR family NAD(P)-dependent oxidoreductase [Halobacteriovorax sp. RT-2-6]|uniref:SDR family NAD(P)-dependent oxidoreductase n=1 Tax=unclassified Halobacteriovorax TaxID=2639665 RepID=UPI003999D645